MLSIHIILILLPAMAFCKIDIKIKARKSISNTMVDIGGEDIDFISDMERDTFKLNDAILKDHSGGVFGRRCNDIYLREPTPWGVYPRYGWHQVQRTLRPLRAKVLSIRSEPVAVTSAKYENFSNLTATYGSTLSQAVEETISNSWSTGGELSIGQKISYSVTFEAVASVGGETSIGYTANWGKTDTKERKITLTSSSNVEIEIPPRRGAMAKLIATRGKLEIQVDYVATVAGHVFCNFDPKHDGHHWYAQYLNVFQRNAHLPTAVRSTEVISIGFYTDSRVEVTDVYVL